MTDLLRDAAQEALRMLETHMLSYDAHTDRSSCRYCGQQQVADFDLLTETAVHAPHCSLAWVQDRVRAALSASPAERRERPSEEVKIGDVRALVADIRTLRGRTEPPSPWKVEPHEGCTGQTWQDFAERCDAARFTAETLLAKARVILSQPPSVLPCAGCVGLSPNHVSGCHNSPEVKEIIRDFPSAGEGKAP